ncbi:MAG: SMP-30/gluconolactonase/LRE family protein [Deltaproteobacteria bacterium]|nr:SMP-30/gluconolactonase/LRE family protein [Deltaproteobacteria bacterium]
MRWAPACIVVVAVLGCRSSTSSESQRITPEAQAPPAKISQRRRQTLDLPGDGNGAVWDAAASTLYVTDDTHNRLVAWTGDTTLAAAGAFPAADRPGLDGLVRLPDQRFVATSFGFGTHGAVFVLAADGAHAVPNLDPKRRRIGLAQAPSGALYVGYFVVEPGSKHTGGIARLDLAGGETDFVAGDLKKPVGLVATDTTLYVADQDQLAIYAYALPDPGPPTVIAKDLPSADHLTRLPNGDLVTGGKKGAVYRVSLDGRVTTIADGYEHVRGTAYDAAQKRLFVVEHSASSSRHKLHILTLE